MDGELTESHETDVDCGGQYCSPCSLEMVFLHYPLIYPSIEQVILSGRAVWRTETVREI